MTLIARLRRLARYDRLLDKQQALIEEQERLIADLLTELRLRSLEHHREMQGIVCAWLIHTDQPEVDVREDLSALERTLGNQVAALEEHVV